MKARLLLGIKRGKPVSQVEIGGALDVTGVTVGRWEKPGGGEPESLLMVERYAQFLRVSPAWLAFGMGPMEMPGESYDEPESELIPETPAKKRKKVRPSA